MLSQGGLFLSEKMADQVAEGNQEVKDLLRKQLSQAKPFTCLLGI